jgi:uncharacterized protein YbjT (DUF2867 family)
MSLSVLVTGVTGYVGGALVPRLLRDGHDVRGFARNARRAPSSIPVVEGDARTGEGLDEAMLGVDVAVFLMHSMEGTEPFGRVEHETAERFVDAARHNGVRRVVYLGGLTPAEDASGGSAHLASRRAVEAVLLRGFEEGVALRASLVVGDGSRSFDFLATIVERLPVLALPAWRDNRTRPIDARDVTEYLARAVASPAIRKPTAFDVGGATELSYGDMVLRIAELAGTPRPSFGVPVSLTSLASRVGAALTSEDAALLEPLMQSLEHTLLPDDEAALQTFGVEPRDFDTSVRWALAARAKRLGAEPAR